MDDMVRELQEVFTKYGITASLGYREAKTEYTSYQLTRDGKSYGRVSFWPNYTLPQAGTVEAV